jgi:hypothetical protein
MDPSGGQKNGFSRDLTEAVDFRSVLDLRETEIENLHAALGEQDVAGLRWTMPFWCTASSASRICSASASA